MRPRGPAVDDLSALVDAVERAGLGRIWPAETGLRVPGEDDHGFRRNVIARSSAL
jgi:hypothetical protein